MKAKSPSLFILLIPVAALLFFALFWYNTAQIKKFGTEHRVLITATESIGKSRYFVFELSGRKNNVTYSKRHRVGDEIPVIASGKNAIEGTKSDSTLLLTIQDFGTLRFWYGFLGLVVVPAFVWLSHLPDKAFAWLPSRQPNPNGKKRR
ncbi:hypothetical protein [Pelagicoccus sp. SDUM812002]|uniref:hypothetical protein n=1 Tax=Pelagicoccus sp. SDUM812002 TaxID=3041266 RepID=UPI00280D9E60|nr:hypothetical protein [Pelagicoccus sp. SDUM812002]MDQ8187088.1 hypothetical protein [Pelagicoccus sp. SDUM812002]